jgi:hypothetical protein
MFAFRRTHINTKARWWRVLLSARLQNIAMCALRALADKGRRAGENLMNKFRARTADKKSKRETHRSGCETAPREVQVGDVGRDGHVEFERILVQHSVPDVVQLGSQTCSKTNT